MIYEERKISKHLAGYKKQNTIEPTTCSLLLNTNGRKTDQGDVTLREI